MPEPAPRPGTPSPSHWGWRIAQAVAALALVSSIVLAIILYQREQQRQARQARALALVETSSRAHPAFLPSITDADLGALREFGLLHKWRGADGPGRMTADDQIQALFLNKAAITEAALKDLARLPRLKDLYLDGEQVTDAWLAELIAHDLLRRARGYRHDSLPGHFLHFFSRNKDGAWLGLDQTRVTHQGLKHLKKVGPLTGLTLNGNQATEDGLKRVAELASPPRLVLTHVTVTAAMLGHLSGVKQLDLTGARIHVTDTVLEILVRNGHLHSLYVAKGNPDRGPFRENHTVDSDDKLESLILRGLYPVDSDDKIQSLMMRGNEIACGASFQITAAGVKCLANLPKLQILDLIHQPITNDALEHLARLPNLRRLDLSDTKVTDAGVKDLQKALSKCEIIHGRTE